MKAKDNSIRWSSNETNYTKQHIQFAQNDVCQLRPRQKLMKIMRTLLRSIRNDMAKTDFERARTKL